MILAGVDGPCVSRLDLAKVKKAVWRELTLVAEEDAEQVIASLPSSLQRAVTVAQEPGASCLVIACHYNGMASPSPRMSSGMQFVCDTGGLCGMCPHGVYVAACFR